MTSTPTVIVPIRSFDGMSRLSEALDAGARHRLGTRLAEGVVGAVRECALPLVVVTSDDEVSQMARRVGARLVADPADGLDGAAAAGVEAASSEQWIVMHADLPLVDADSLGQVARLVARGDTVVVPSLDGGTNVVASAGTFPFAFGPSSFHRHLAARPYAVVLPDPRLAVDIDTPNHLAAVGIGSSVA